MGKEKTKLRKEKIKCYQCKKKLPLIYSNCICKCGHIFCNKHMYRHVHKCSFDSKSETKKVIQENNPKIKLKKV